MHIKNSYTSEYMDTKQETHTITDVTIMAAIDDTN